MKKKTRLIPLKTLIKYNSFLRGSNRRSRFGDNELCGICIEDLNNVTYENENSSNEPTGGICTLNCNHKFHCNCINEWYSTGKNTCPICRAVQVPTRELPVIVPQNPRRRLLPSFDEAADRPSSPPRRYGSLGLVPSNTPRLRRSNAVNISPPRRPFNEINGISQEAQQFFEEHGFIPASMMRDYPDPFDSPPRVRINTPSIPGAPRRPQRPPRR